MKILTFRRIIGLTAIGVAYVHGRRGGDWSLASLADTLDYLWCSATERLGLAGRAPRPAPDRATGPSGPAPGGPPDERVQPYDG